MAHALQVLWRSFLSLPPSLPWPCHMSPVPLLPSLLAPCPLYMFLFVLVSCCFTSARDGLPSPPHNTVGCAKSHDESHSTHTLPYNQNQHKCKFSHPKPRCTARGGIHHFLAKKTQLVNYGENPLPATPPPIRDSQTIIISGGDLVLVREFLFPEITSVARGHWNIPKSSPQLLMMAGYI